MFPYITIRGAKIFMTGFGIVIGFIIFLLTAYYLIRKYHQDFWKFFYRLPIFTILMYIIGVYVDFALSISIVPTTRNEFLNMISPYGYKFHFAGIIIGMIIALRIFFKRIKRNENKKIRIDILFYSIGLSMIPIGIFFLLGDDFIGKSCSNFICIKPLNIESELNKFNGVYPVGLFVSIGAFLSILFTGILRKKKKIFGLGIWGLIILIIITNIVMMIFQNYPKYGTISLGGIIFDIKQYASFIAIMILIYSQQKRKKDQI